MKFSKLGKNKKIFETKNKINKRGVLIRAGGRGGGADFFSKKIKQKEDVYSGPKSKKILL